MTDTDTEQQAPPAEQRIDLGDGMALVKRGDVLAVDHWRLAEPEQFNQAQLVRWLRTKILRGIF